MKPNFALTLLSAALLAAPASFGQGATSGIVGFSTLTCPAGGAVVVPTLVNSSVFQGQAAISSDGLTITPVTAPGWTVGAYNKTSFANPTPNYPKFFAEVVSGAQEGLVLDIDSNSATALTMISPVVPAGLRGTTVQIAIREHMTLTKIVQGSTGLSAYDDVATAYATNGIPFNRIYVGAPDYWVTDNGVTPAGHTVVYPGSGFFLASTGTVQLSMMGEVKPTKTQVPLYASTVNIVGPLNPASSTALFGSNLTTLLAPYDDVFTSFSTDGSLSELPYYSDGTVIRRDNGVALTGASTDAIPLNRGLTIGVQADTVWVINSPLAP